MNTELIEKITEVVKAHGFEATGYTEASKLKVRPEVRDMCASDKCHAYDRNWSCPPACGDIEYFQGEIDKRNDVIVFQTIGEMEDSFDFEAMLDTAELHSDRMPDLVKDIRKIVDDPLLLLAGACTICDECSYPDAPCRFPDLVFPSMEAAGLVVADVCKAAEIPYNYGSDHIAYTSCILI